MNVTMFRATVKPEHVTDIEAAVRTMFMALAARRSPGVKYASSHLSDSTTFVIFLALENPDENPLPAIPEFRAFQESTKGWLAEPTHAEPLTVVGSYNLF